jgi:hypothetical protein
MLAIGKVLLSEDLIEKKFVCDLNACKGACCVGGDSGAPLDKDELEIMEKIWPKVKPYVPASGVKAIEKQGTHVIDSDGDDTTPLVEGTHCAFTYFEKDGTAKCAIEKAHAEGKIKFKKPISCHLYPIRITVTKSGEALNYDRWDLCKPACKCGEKLDVPVYRFLRAPLERKYGKQWYSELELAAGLLEKKKKASR